MTTPDSQEMGLREELARYVVLKASGSRFAYVNDTLKGVTVKRYDILKGEGKRNGWNMAKRHADDLNAADKAKETPNG